MPMIDSATLGLMGKSLKSKPNGMGWFVVICFPRTIHRGATGGCWCLAFSSEPESERATLQEAVLTADVVLQLHKPWHGVHVV